MTASCPLCLGQSIDHYHSLHKSNKVFNYFKCSDCQLVFMDRKNLLAASEEKQRYDQHQNNVRSIGYENFLSSLIDPVLEKVSQTDQGLDYGSGPYPMMAKIIQEKGYQISTYDPFYDDDTNALDKTYDYITCCEVVEHFYYPRDDFNKLISLMALDGILGIRTDFLTEDINFSKWHYKEDDTHVAFYNEATFRCIEKIFGLKIIDLKKNIVIFAKA